MKVYVELVFIDNFILDFSISTLSYAVLGKRVKISRAVLTSLLGAVLALTYPFWTLPTFLLAFAKLLVGVLLGAVLFLGEEKPVLGVLLFFLATAVVGGFCFFVNYLILGASALYASVLPYGVPAVVGAVLTYFFKYVLRASHAKKVRHKYSYNALVTVRGKDAHLTAYLDTGNRIYDDKTFLPVIVMRRTSFTRSFGVLPSVETEIKGAVGVGKLYLIKPDDFVLYLNGGEHRHIEVMIGVCENDFELKEDMLLHPAVMEVESV